MPPMDVSLRRSPKTIDDYRALPDDVRAELIRGEIYVTPSPSARRHQDVVGEIYVHLKPHVESRGLGRVYLSPVDVHLPSGDVVGPDLVHVARERLHIVADVITGIPDLAIEVVSPSHPERDRIVKRCLYAENGVPEYWIVEPDSRAIQVLRLDGGEYRPAGYFTAESHLVSPTIPALRMPVGGLFRF
jgi:Uma2 family endonuclease